MAYYPYSVELGAIYKLVSPDTGATAVFNDVTDPNYVGFLTEITGLDSPEIRESAEDLVEADGGSHGFFWASRRPISITARIASMATVRDREIRIDRARRASLALRSDATLSWKPSPEAQVSNPSWIEMFTTVRRQGPFRESGAWVKDIQIPLVSEYAPVYSVVQNSAAAAAGVAVSVENRGSWQTFPILRIAGPTSVTNPQVTGPAGTVFKTTGSLLIASGETVEIDTQNHTAVFTSGARNGQNATSFIDFTTTIWPVLPPAVTSSYTLNGTTGTLTVLWRHAWL